MHEEITKRTTSDFVLPERRKVPICRVLDTREEHDGEFADVRPCVALERDLPHQTLQDLCSHFEEGRARGGARLEAVEQGYDTDSGGLSVGGKCEGFEEGGCQLGS